MSRAHCPPPDIKYKHASKFIAWRKKKKSEGFECRAHKKSKWILLSKCICFSMQSMCKRIFLSLWFSNIRYKTSSQRWFDFICTLACSLIYSFFVAVFLYEYSDPMLIFGLPICICDHFSLCVILSYDLLVLGSFFLCSFVRFFAVFFSKSLRKDAFRQT